MGILMWRLICTNQHLYLFWEGEIVLESDFVSGDMTKSGRMTPPGVFGLTYKTRNAVLRGEDYETPVNYWMPFNGNIGMHDATWRSSFGEAFISQTVPMAVSTFHWTRRHKFMSMYLQGFL